MATGGDSDDDEGPLVMETGGDDGPSGGTKDISAIRKEVASMLGELGLAAAAGLSTDGFDDRDFRPPPKKEAKKEKAEKKAGTDKQRCDLQLYCSAAACAAVAHLLSGFLEFAQSAAPIRDTAGPRTSPSSPQRQRRRGGERKWRRRRSRKSSAAAARGRGTGMSALGPRRSLSSRRSST